MVETVNSSTLIDNGFQLSSNFLLEHMTSGAYHPKIAMWLPIFSSKLLPSNYNGSFTNTGYPLWKIVRNLQLTTDNIVESLFNQIGSDLIIKSGYTVPNASQILNLGTSLNSLGLAVDIQVKNYEDNPFAIAKDIASLAGKASNIQMCFNNNSWFHIESTVSRLSQDVNKLSTPILQTIDYATNTIESGLTSMFGLS